MQRNLRLWLCFRFTLNVISSVTFLHLKELVPTSASNNTNCGPRHLWHVVNLSLQLKLNPMVRLFCISSHDKRLTRKAGLMPAGSGRFGCGRLIWGGLVNLRCRTSCSSFILARLIASFSVRGLIIRIPSAISDFNPPIKVPTNAF